MALSVTLAALFVWSAIAKLMSRAETLDVMRAFAPGKSPRQYRALFVGLLAFEGAVVALWSLSALGIVSSWLPAVLTVAFLVGASALFVRILRSKDSPPEGLRCNCFGGAIGGELSMADVARNGLIGVLAIAAGVGGQSGQVAAIDFLLVPPILAFVMLGAESVRLFQINRDPFGEAPHKWETRVERH